MQASVLLRAGSGLALCDVNRRHKDAPRHRHLHLLPRPTEAMPRSLPLWALGILKEREPYALCSDSQLPCPPASTANHLQRAVEVSPNDSSKNYYAAIQKAKFSTSIVRESWPRAIQLVKIQRWPLSKLERSKICKKNKTAQPENLGKQTIHIHDEMKAWPSVISFLVHAASRSYHFGTRIGSAGSLDVLFIP